MLWKRERKEEREINKVVCVWGRGQRGKGKGWQHDVKWSGGVGRVSVWRHSGTAASAPCGSLSQGAKRSQPASRPHPWEPGHLLYSGPKPADFLTCTGWRCLAAISMMPVYQLVDEMLIWAPRLCFSQVWLALCGEPPDLFPTASMSAAHGPPEPHRAHLAKGGINGINQTWDLDGLHKPSLRVSPNWCHDPM